MMLNLRAAASVLLIAMSAGGTVSAQKPGGVLKMYSIDSPASMSILEESTVFAEGPMMGVFNNLIMFDQHVKQNSLQSIVPDLATSWSWNEEETELTLPLRYGVKWHDGKPFTAQDVKCTWDLLMDTASEKLRVNPRKASYRNLDRVTANGDYEITFHLKRPQPAFQLLLADGFSAIYPCHVPPREMRQHPIGTGPFKFVEFKPNERITVSRNPDYWKPDRPYLDGIEYTIIKNLSTAVLGFTAGKFDTTFIPVSLTVPLLNQVQSQMPDAICEVTPGTINRHLLVNRDKPPFDKSDLRRAMALSIDRNAFIDTLTQGFLHPKLSTVELYPPGHPMGPPSLLSLTPQNWAEIPDTVVEQVVEVSDAVESSSEAAEARVVSPENPAVDDDDNLETRVADDVVEQALDAVLLLASDPRYAEAIRRRLKALK